MTSGYLLVNKPQGPTSHDVVDTVRKISGQRQVGHAGTLDPLAEGLLILLLGGYTKKSSEFMKLDKEYIADFELGKKSDTHDIEGIIEEVKNFKIPDKEKIEKVLDNFRGKIQQVPPQFSAIKIKGKKAYDEARAGRKVEIAPREINISRLEVLDYRFPKLKLKIACSSGTYIRSLARDIGSVMTKLTRTKVGNYNLEDAVNLMDLDKMFKTSVQVTLK